MAFDAGSPSEGESSASALVTPWQALSVTMKPVPPAQVRATRKARSLASLPVQVNMTWPISAGKVARSFSA
ncbi:hypothetical protein KMZ93_17485 [Bradyrhizobium sediminis]|uniref:Uncharacterized protein n=1 Tax=Bradyrhizobium sediminis TaxID=2840469 RepID=A0A975RVJ5_9BRAD|nr:hypothetical protein [Bradyrhizobium sediminis]QWG21780.1 hypothetical protein KMZ93_17485 [Bradyrhizobium sediminis]